MISKLHKKQTSEQYSEYTADQFHHNIMKDRQSCFLQNTICLGSSREPSKGSDGKAQDFFYGIRESALADHRSSGSDLQQSAKRKPEESREERKVFDQCGKDRKEHDVSADFQKKEDRRGNFGIDGFGKRNAGNRDRSRMQQAVFVRIFFARPEIPVLWHHKRENKASEKGREKDKQIKDVHAGGQVKLVSGYKENDKHRTRIIRSSGKKKSLLVGQDAVLIKFSSYFGADRIARKHTGGDEKVFEWFSLHISTDQGSEHRKGKKGGDEDCGPQDQAVSSPFSCHTGEEKEDEEKEKEQDQHEEPPGGICKIYE